ncbi:MAG TPA: HNH endonuclease [Polyangiaceae bacterium]|nr:HNH endonuclease [Polyangiaceae bacterium]
MAKGSVVGHHETIKKLYIQGMSLSGIARLASVATTQVAQVLERAGLRKRAKMRSRDIELESKIAADYAAGVVPTKLVEQYGVSEWKVRDCVKRHGVPLRPRGQQRPVYSAEEVDEMLELWRKGVSQFDIGRKLGVGQTTVSRLLASRGITNGGQHAKGERHGMWKGGRSKNQEGYALVLLNERHPFWSMSNSAGYVLEHRLVMARKLKRPLRPNETVHHIDGDKTNNKISNLQLRQGRHGNGECHVCLDCGSRNIGATKL